MREVKVEVEVEVEEENKKPENPKLKNYSSLLPVDVAQNLQPFPVIYR